MAVEGIEIETGDVRNIKLRAETRLVPVKDLIAYATNGKKHPEAQIDLLANSIREFGFNVPVIIDAGRVLVAGHGRVLAAKKLGMKEVPCVEVGDLTPTQIRRLRLLDNKIAELGKEHEENVRIEIEELGDLQLADLFGIDLGGDDGNEGGGEWSGELGDLVGIKDAIARGDVFLLNGKHRFGYGDSTDPAMVKAVTEGAAIDVLLTDPPYCSGWFQEGQRSAGSIGSKQVGSDGKANVTPTIANDTLSTRGYQALIKSVLTAWQSSFCYAFTDWRMWNALFDIFESSGYGVRSMIVWDKGTPGMGLGWRSQHELCMFWARAKFEYDKHRSGQGNVITMDRSGNPLHPTQKPLELIKTMASVMEDFCETYADPFTGSGTTLMAVDSIGKTFYGMETDPEHVATVLKRFASKHGPSSVVCVNRTLDLAPFLATDRLGISQD